MKDVKEELVLEKKVKSAVYGCAHQYTGKSIQRTQSDKGDSLKGGNSLNALSDRIVPDRAKWVKDESCLSVDQDNIVEVKRKFEEIRLDRSMKKMILQEIPVAVLAFGISCTFAKNH